MALGPIAKNCLYQKPDLVPVAEYVECVGR